MLYCKRYALCFRVYKYFGGVGSNVASGGSDESRRAVFGGNRPCYDSGVVFDRLSEGALAMLRGLQVARSALKILKTRLFRSYDWKIEMAQQCRELGGVYIKFLQMLAVHKSTKHIVDGMGSELAFEQVPYEPINVSREIGPLANKISHIDDKPFAAGSYGQVYLAQLKTGERIVVKILRPSVRRTLPTDLRILHVVGRLVAMFTGASMVNFHAMEQEFARATWRETNYMLEAERGEQLRDYFGQRGTIAIPRSFVDLTTRTVLVQEYMGGVSLASVMSKQRAGFAVDTLVRQAVGSNIWAQLEVLGTELLRASVYADYIMIDPHPGNIRLLPGDKVALIDFGLIALAPTNRSSFAGLIHEMCKLYEDNFEAGNFAVAMLAFFDVELHDALERLTQERSQKYTFSLVDFIDSFVARTAQKTEIQHYLSDKQLMQLFSNILNQDNKLGIRINQDNALLQRSMTMYMSIVRTISDIHSERVYERVIHACLKAVDDEVQLYGVTEVISRHEMSTERALEVASDWLTAIAERDRNLYRFITARSYVS